MRVDYITHMGDDLFIANCARVSYAKEVSEWSDREQRLLNYLAMNGHISPFFHPQLSFRITCPLYVAAQLKRHQVGLAINEVSRRYVKDDPSFDIPDVWRVAPQPGQSKQGSGEPHESQEGITDWVIETIRQSSAMYQSLVRAGVAPEQARVVLPVATETQFIWTGSLYAFIRVCRERLAPDSQAETREVALQIYKHLLDHFPHSMEAWGLGESEE